MKKSNVKVSIITSAMAVLTMLIVSGFSGDYYFDLNDDVLIKDILSGAYTGTPEGHNIQMLYPVSLFISILYRIGKNIDWYGIFLCFLQYFCFGVVIFKSIEKLKKTWEKILLATYEVVIILSAFLPHFLYVQYTVVCGLLSATAAFLIIMGKDKWKTKIGAENILAIVLITIAYLLRSEMLLLTLPMVGVAILIKWLIGDMNELKRYVYVCLIIALCLGLGSGIHRLAYSSSEWKVFNSVFDNRTELYDFQFIPEYAENKAFYQEIGLSESQQKLLVNYNFGLDEKIDADVLKAVADYASTLRGEEKPFFERLNDSLKLYFYRLHHIGEIKGYEYPMTDFPWNVMVIVLYIAVFVALLLDKVGTLKAAFMLATLFLCRSALWLFIIIRGRDPIRITHPLYLIEMLILMALLFTRSNKKWVEGICCAGTTLLLLTGIIALPHQIETCIAEKESRETVVADYNELYSYCKSNENNFYYIDVYSSVAYSEKMFKNVDNSFCNYDIMGGWASKSPLWYKKINKTGNKIALEALLCENVYYVQSIGGDTTWLNEFYADKGFDIEVSFKERIADKFDVFEVTIAESSDK